MISQRFKKKKGECHWDIPWVRQVGNWGWGRVLERKWKWKGSEESGSLSNMEGKGNAVRSPSMSTIE